MAKGKGVKKIVISVLAIFGMVFISNMVFADPINVRDSIYLYDREGGNNGGEFGVQKQAGGSNNPNDDLFRTFCLEKDEYFNPGGEFKVGGISTLAVRGGVNTDSGDPLDPLTAYLYTKFRTHTLKTPYDYSQGTSRHIADATALQLAIWFIENELPTGAILSGKALDLYNEASTSDWGGRNFIGNVRVINLKYLNGTNAQDQLVLVPEPSTLLLLGAGLLGLGILGRKKFRTKP